VLGKKLGAKMKAFAALLETDAELRAKAQSQQPFAYAVDGEPVEFEKDDFVVELVSPDGLFVAMEGDNWVALDTVITPELEREGLMRDILRNLQMMRKDMGLEIEDRCAVVYATEDATLAQVIEEWGDVMAEELLCVSLMSGDPGDGAKDIKVASGRMRVALSKAERVS
jgi:isoleucyl-tRNA synthetase